jgi:uncharacterized paraquat-inducible protein A
VGKLIFFLIIAGVIYALFKKSTKTDNNNNNYPDELVACKRCQTFVPKSELKNGLCKECYANS